MTVELTGPAPGRAGLRHWIGITWLLAVRQYRLRFLRSRLGAGWLLVQPLLQALLLAFLFSRVFKVRGIDNYPLYVLSGVLTWQAFASATSSATSSAVDNAALLRKVDMPPLVFPLAQVLATCLVFATQSVLLVGAAVVAGTVSLKLLLLPIVLLLIGLCATAVGTLACSLHVAYRDVKFLVDGGLLMAFYATPVVYDPEQLDEGLRRLLALNPMYGAESLVRAVLLDRPLDVGALVSGALTVGVLLAAGLTMFRIRSRAFADLV